MQFSSGLTSVLSTAGNHLSGSGAWRTVDKTPELDPAEVGKLIGRDLTVTTHYDSARFKPALENERVNDRIDSRAAFRCRCYNEGCIFSPMNPGFREISTYGKYGSKHNRRVNPTG